MQEITEVSTYAMDDHEVQTGRDRTGAPVGTEWNRIARTTRAQWRLQVLPEKYSCLASSDPGDQLQAALKQIESLLNRNAQLVQAIVALDCALSKSRFMIRKAESNDQQKVEQLLICSDSRRCAVQLKGEPQTDETD